VGVTRCPPANSASRGWGRCWVRAVCARSQFEWSNTTAFRTGGGRAHRPRRATSRVALGRGIRGPRWSRTAEDAPHTAGVSAGRMFGEGFERGRNRMGRPAGRSPPNPGRGAQYALRGPFVPRSGARLRRGSRTRRRPRTLRPPPRFGKGETPARNDARRSLGPSPTRRRFRARGPAGRSYRLVERTIRSHRAHLTDGWLPRYRRSLNRCISPSPKPHAVVEAPSR
jgi:hypothetical protein